MDMGRRGRATVRALLRAVVRGVARALVPGLALAGLPALGWAQAGVHAHGVARLDVAVDGGQVTLRFEAPLDSLLGYEHAPRNKQERQALTAMRTHLGAPAALFVFDADAVCRVVVDGLHSPVLEPPAPAHAAHGGPAGDHADLEAAYTARCARPAALATVNVSGLLASFPRLQRIDVQVAAPGGQMRQAVERPNAVVKLTR